MITVCEIPSRLKKQHFWGRNKGARVCLLFWKEGQLIPNRDKKKCKRGTETKEPYVHGITTLLYKVDNTTAQCNVTSTSRPCTSAVIESTTETQDQNTCDLAVVSDDPTNASKSVNASDSTDSADTLILDDDRFFEQSLSLCSRSRRH